jgi:2'-5' RNA ligase
MSEALRSFIAVKLPPETVERLRQAQARLRAADTTWKWVEPGCFHLTLKFLGAVPRVGLEAVWGSVCAALAGTRSFTVSLRGLGVFPNARAPRVAWAGIDRGAAELAGMAATVEEACAAHGFERERWAFTAHLTLGRAREPKPNPALAAVIEELSAVELGEAKVDRALLMKSTLTPKGAIYQMLEEKLLESGEAG